MSQKGIKNIKSIEHVEYPEDLDNKKMRRRANSEYYCIDRIERRQLYLRYGHTMRKRLIIHKKQEVEMEDAEGMERRYLPNYEEDWSDKKRQLMDATKAVGTLYD